MKNLALGIYMAIVISMFPIAFYMVMTVKRPVGKSFCRYKIQDIGERERNIIILNNYIWKCLCIKHGITPY